MLKILMLAAEASPLVKVGGLGDVLGALPAALRARGHDVRVMIPHYGTVDDARYGVEARGSVEVLWGGSRQRATVARVDVGGVPHYLIGGSPIARDGTVYGPDITVDGPKYVFFSVAALQAAQALGFRADILHVHDSHPGAAVYWLAEQRATNAFWARTASVLTIHNLPYQNNRARAALALGGLRPSRDARIPPWARDSLMGLAINYADAINAVSPGYAAEVLGTEHGAGLEALLGARAERLTGILNGLDYEQWNPEMDDALPQRFGMETISARASNKTALQQELGLDPKGGDVPLFGVVSRLDQQKGFDLVTPALQRILQEYPAQLALLGAGAPEIERALRGLQQRFPGRVALSIGFDARLARRIYGGADVFLMPSRYEPCGLSQMIAMRYGAVPVVRATGGLRDTVVDYDSNRRRSTGFVFTEYTAAGFVSALRRALEVFPDRRRWRGLQRRGMLRRFTWDLAALRYTQLYERALHHRSRESAGDRQLHAD